MITIELHGGPLDGERVEIHPKACEFRHRIGGTRPRPRWVEGQGFPLLPVQGGLVVVYQKDAAGAFRYSELESEAEVQAQ